MAIETDERGLRCQALMEYVAAIGDVGDHKPDLALSKFRGKSFESASIAKPAFVPKFDLQSEGVVPFIAEDPKLLDALRREAAATITGVEATPSIASRRTTVSFAAKTAVEYHLQILDILGKMLLSRQSGEGRCPDRDRLEWTSGRCISEPSR